MITRMRIQNSREFRWLLSQVKPSFVCTSAVIVHCSCQHPHLIDPLIVKIVIDDVIPNRRISWLPLVAVAFFFTYMGRLGFDSLAAMLNFRAVQKMTFRREVEFVASPATPFCRISRQQTAVGDTLHRLQS